MDLLFDFSFWGVLMIFCFIFFCFDQVGFLNFHYFPREIFLLRCGAGFLQNVLAGRKTTFTFGKWNWLVGVRFRLDWF